MFKSKAQNLIYIQNKIKSAAVLPVITTSLYNINNNKNEVITKIKTLNANKLIIRSSSKKEDNNTSSNAGAFLSISNVSINNIDVLVDSIKKVGKSMPYEDDEILIQPMLEDIAICGVAFSVDKENNAPYFSISYDSSGSNEVITSGKKGDIQNFYHYRLSPYNGDSNITKIINMIKELEEIFDSKTIDVEFAITKSKKLYCLQVRPLIMDNKPNFYDFVTTNALSRLHKRLKVMNEKHPHILGDKAIFGVMPDWNPAEIIGLKPKRLALSLYKEIVTDNIWAYQRDNYGYKNLRSYPLMHSFLGIPYIDVRISFNSFIPKNLDNDIAKKLVNYYIQTLIKYPELHDKIEFAIVFSCYDLNLSCKLKRLLRGGEFNENEIKRIEFSLLELTNNIINQKDGLYIKDINKAKLLEERYEKIINSNLSIYDKIYWLIEDCKRFGTLPFAGVARAAFIAMQLLDSMVEIGFFSIDEKMQFLSSLKTISKQLAFDSKNLSSNNIDTFLDKYGHLRAGSYNILSPRYDEAFEIYFKEINLTQKCKEISNNDIFVLDEYRYKELDKILSENGLKINSKELFDFFKTAIEGREEVKFQFSKLLSKAISLIKDLGDSIGISKDDMAHLDIKSILSLYSSLYQDSPKERFLNEIKAHKKEYDLTLALKLPLLITSNNDIYSFYSSKISPNFITRKNITADTILIEDTNIQIENIENKIAIIKSADPGYDYLFTKNIAGLITCYGGANSHMAIRASEIGLPSVIGVGEENFSIYKSAKKLRIECESEQIFCI